MTVYLNDVDISQYVQGNSFALTSAKGEVGQVLINPIPSLVGIDTDGFWNVRNPASVFYNVNDFSVYQIDIYEDDLLIFTGFVQNINRQSDIKVQVDLQTELQQILQKNIIYSSGSAYKNPAEIFIEVCIQYKITYDPVSTFEASNLYNTNSVVCSAYALKSDISILSFLEALAQVGVASIYAIGNTLYFSIYNTTKSSVYTLTDSVLDDRLYLLDSPSIATIQKEIPTSYSITYRDDTISEEQDQTYEYGDQANSFSIQAGGSDLVIIQSTQSAVWIGEQWLAYLGSTNVETVIPIGTRLARDLKVGYPITIRLEGAIDLDVVITEITIQNSVSSIIKGVSYAE